MFLRSLTLKGFKSFADKTTLEFVPGVSVIVGPNGSGKSNLVDAIAWVLGEQGARSLRGGQMADVIFAGSPQRPGLGLAEVQLVIDNEAGRIPVPMSELQISRTVYRSGESEYKIGGEVRRLMDIQELLSDSGIGRTLHTIVGQGQLDEVLTARPEERRQFIEEAAGIAKHRRRKDRAQRKLASLDQDLLRLQDVLTELRRQLKPLRQQAEMAKKHEALSAEADDLSWRTAAARLRGLLDTRDSRKPAWEQGITARAEAKEHLELLDSEIASLTLRREAATTALGGSEAALREAIARKGEADERLQLARAMEASARSKLASGSSSTQRVDVYRADLDVADAELAALASAIVQRESELAAADQRFQSAQEQRRQAEDVARRAGEELAGRRAEIDTLRRSLVAYEREREGLEAQIEEAHRSAVAASTELESLEQRKAQRMADSAPLSTRSAALADEHERLSAQAEELEATLRTRETQRAVLEARRSDRSQTPGSRFISTHEGRAAGLLGELIRPHRGWEKALIAALGAAADAAVYEDRGAAVADAAAGEGVLILTPPVSPAMSSPSGGHRLLDHCTVDARAVAAAEAMLGDVFVADNISMAEDELRSDPDRSFVSIEGVLVGVSSIQTASEAASHARVLADELEAVERAIAAAASSLRPLKRRLGDLVGERDDVSEQLAATQVELASLTSDISRTDSALGAARREEELLLQRRTGLDDSAAVWRETLAATEQHPLGIEAPLSLPPVPEPPVAERVAFETARREQAIIEGRSAQLRLDLDALLAATPDQLHADLEAASAALTHAEAAAVSSLQGVEAAQTTRDAAANEQRDATTAEAQTNAAWRQASAELDLLRESYEGEDRARGDLERRIGDAQQLLADGHQKDPAEAVAALSEDDTLEGLERSSELVAKRLGMLGRVNVLATGEFEAQEERHDFMQRELDDVRKARRDLLEVVQQIDAEVVKLFDAAYRDVASEFERMFTNLFPGGEGRLVLTDPANPLETGIDIEARPGRKRVNRLSLLSGGERSLTALGFLFAIFRARPSPFYLLDEVEAALDDVNLHRFLGLIRDFSQHSQVLIVTHQKRTMEAAELMYGVSMNQDGSSRVLCQTLDDPTPDSPAEMVSDSQHVN